MIQHGEDMEMKPFVPSFTSDKLDENLHQGLPQIIHRLSVKPMMQFRDLFSQPLKSLQSIFERHFGISLNFDSFHSQPRDGRDGLWSNVKCNIAHRDLTTIPRLHNFFTTCCGKVYWSMKFCCVYLNPQCGRSTTNLRKSLWD